MEYPLNIYITAHTLISSLGFGISENKKAIHDYRSGIRMQEAGRISDSPILAGMIDSVELEKRAKELDYDYVVTGHYARIEEQDVDIQTGLFVPSFFLGVPHGECFIGIHPRRADLGERGGGSGVAQGEGQQNGGKAGEELVQAHSGLLMRGYASCWRRGRPETRA